jgi:hypothetical protein
MRELKSQFRNVTELLHDLRSTSGNQDNHIDEQSTMAVPVKTVDELQLLEEQLSQDNAKRRQLVNKLLSHSKLFV